MPRDRRREDETAAVPAVAYPMMMTAMLAAIEEAADLCMMMRIPVLI